LAVGVLADASTAVVEMTVHGAWSQHLGGQVAAIMRLCLAGPAASIIVDLHDLGDPHGVSLRFWSAMSREARLGTAPAQLALCVPAMTMLDSRLRQPDGNEPRVYATMSEARSAIAGRLPRAYQLQARLAPRPASVRTARDLVARACHAWGLPQVQEAWLVVSELVTNAVEHAGTEVVITVSTRGDAGLHLAVRDGAPGFPHLREPSSAGRPAALPERGRGLRLVHAAAAVWGVVPTRGGKVVWATVLPNHPEPSGSAG
jgi:anti-sigma regulatory factor (Ser/Thr protein kinase)